MILSSQRETPESLGWLVCAQVCLAGACVWWLGLALRRAWVTGHLELLLVVCSLAVAAFTPGLVASLFRRLAILRRLSGEVELPKTLSLGERDVLEALLRTTDHPVPAGRRLFRVTALAVVLCHLAPVLAGRVFRVSPAPFVPVLLLVCSLFLQMRSNGAMLEHDRSPGGASGSGAQGARVPQGSG